MSRIMILPGTNRKSGTSKAGKAYEFVELEAVRLDTGPYPDKFTLSFKPDNVPAPGEYDVDWAASIYVNKRDFNRLGIGDLKLSPASADAKPRAVAG